MIFDSKDIIQQLEAFLQAGGEPLQPQEFIVEEVIFGNKVYRKTITIPREGAPGDVTIKVSISTL